MNKEFKKIPIKDLIPYENNPRINSEAVKYVEESMKQCENIDPIEVDENLVILSGHTRLIALKRLGYKETDVVIVSGLTEEQKKKYRILANKTAEIAEWDLEKLEAELDGLDFGDFDFGFDIPDLLPPEPEIVEDIVPEKVETISQLGDIWELGPHRLLCGDSTSETDLAKLMQNEVADLLITDPPYNVALGYDMTIEEAKIRRRRMDGLTVKNDSFETGEQFFEFLKKAFTNANKVMKPGGAYYIWYASREVVNVSNALEASGLPVRQELIWNKNRLVLGRQDYQWKHEPCLYGWKEGAGHYFINDRTFSTIFDEGEPLDPSKLKKEELVKILAEILQLPTTIIDEDRPSRSEQHPTMKPIKLIARQIKNSTRPGEIVLDIFGGSGSTLIACEQLQRPCRTVELSEQYCDVIIQRYINLKDSIEGVYRIRDGERVKYKDVFK